MPNDEPAPAGEIILYRTADGGTRIECRFENENVWLTQARMAELFQTTPQNITLHLRAIYEEGELAEAATCKDSLQVQTEGERDILTGAGRVEKAVADKLAADEYDKFHARRLALEAAADTKSFEEAVKKLPAKKPRKKT